MLVLKLICFLLLVYPISPLVFCSACLWNKQKMTESFYTFFFSYNYTTEEPVVSKWQTTKPCQEPC